MEAWISKLELYLVVAWMSDPQTLLLMSCWHLAKRFQLAETASRFIYHDFIEVSNLDPT
jgi:hypothetical protein